MIARSATSEFAIQVLEVYVKRVLSHMGKRQDEISSIHPRDPGRPLLRDAPMFRWLTGSTLAVLTVSSPINLMVDGSTVKAAPLSAAFAPRSVALLGHDARYRAFAADDLGSAM